MFQPYFTEKQDRPDDDALAAALGRAYGRWQELVSHLEATYPDAKLEWKHYGKKHGWQVKVAEKRRSLLYLTPQEKCFLAGLALRETAFPSLRKAGLPKEFVREIQSGTPFMEGYPARVYVRTKKDVETVRKLLAVKAGG